MTEENFRVDLPQSFKSEKKQFSLSWHQESGYFRNYVSHLKGFVVWIPLLTLQLREVLGAFPESHLLGPLVHTEYYADPANKKLAF